MRSEAGEYISSCLRTVKDLESFAAKRNKTTKILAIKTILMLLKIRLEATDKAFESGGSGPDMQVHSVVIYRELYNPVIEYLTKELT